MFLPPAAAVVPKARRSKPLAAEAVRYQRYRPRRRTLCDDCIRDIHERGVQVAPLPQAAAWRRITGGGTVDVLCDPHRRARIEVER